MLFSRRGISRGIFQMPKVFDAQKKSSHCEVTGFLGIFGRDGVIRTLDPLHPMQVRYRAALRPDYILITSENDEESTLTS